jgi:hypothetical protein
MLEPILVIGPLPGPHYSTGRKLRDNIGRSSPRSSKLTQEGLPDSANRFNDVIRD